MMTWCVGHVLAVPYQDFLLLMRTRIPAGDGSTQTEETWKTLHSVTELPDLLQDTLIRPSSISRSPAASSSPDVQRRTRQPDCRTTTAGLPDSSAGLPNPSAVECAVRLRQIADQLNTTRSYQRRLHHSQMRVRVSISSQLLFISVAAHLVFTSCRLGS